MNFSICIPNYNYERYLGRTVQSVLDQAHPDFEILISDNASSDRSVEVVKAFENPRIKLQVNACNVGFAGNLDRAARMAASDHLIMLSSDDLARHNSLVTYQALLEALGTHAVDTVLTSAVDVIDPDDRIIGRVGPDPTLWHEADRNATFEAVVDAPVYRVAGHELLRRCLATMRNPFNFAATCYPRALYNRIEGYGGNRLINPDKWFHWKLLGQADTACYVDKALFAYRWHPQNQTVQQSSTGALKYLVDEYVSTLEFDGGLLERLGFDREALVRAFVEYDIARHGLATLARGNRDKARRILRFGRSVYPAESRKNWKNWVLGTLLALGPLGGQVARLAYSRRQSDRGAL